MIRSMIVLVVAIATLTGCAKPYARPEFISTGSAGTTSIKGIAAAIEETGSADVILIHGMCTHDAFWAVDTHKLLLESLGEPPELTQMVTADKLLENRGWFDDTMVITMSYELNGALKGKRLNTYSIIWSQVNTQLKARLCDDCKEGTSGCGQDNYFKGRRAWANNLLKTNLLNDCLSDAVIYSGSSGDKIKSQVKQALMDIFKKRQEKSKGTAPLFLYAESLGSKILFDALNSIQDDPNSDLATQSVRQVFLAANQIPLLELASQREKQSATPYEHVNKFAQKRKQLLLRSTGKEENLHVTAFTDPNDLLSYTLTNSPSVDPKDFAATDVLVSNGISYLWLVQEPYSAHTGYPTNEEVFRIIACGHPEWASCPPRKQEKPIIYH